jgi:ActR/RegA family two-component response regulator
VSTNKLGSLVGTDADFIREVRATHPSTRSLVLCGTERVACAVCAMCVVGRVVRHRLPASTRRRVRTWT